MCTVYESHAIMGLGINTCVSNRTELLARYRKTSEADGSITSTGPAPYRDKDYVCPQVQAHLKLEWEASTEREE